MRRKTKEKSPLLTRPIAITASSQEPSFFMDAEALFSVVRKQLKRTVA
jgi:hypothetical protein